MMMIVAPFSPRSNTMPNRRDSPLYTDAVYGIRNMKTMRADAVLRVFESKRFSKYSGIVFAPMWFVIRRVRLPRRKNGIRLPMKAFPMPTHEAETP